MEQGKEYPELRERMKRMQVFQNNLLLINSLNEAQNETEFRVNKFADLSPLEFKARMLMVSREVEYS